MTRSRDGVTMSPELIAILMTDLIQIGGLVIIARMERENARILQHIDGVDAAIFLQGRQMKEVLEEIRRFLLTESARLPRSSSKALRSNAPSAPQYRKKRLPS